MMCKLHREKVGRKSDAILLLNKRRNDRYVGAKMPENLRAALVKFGEIADYITEEFTQAHHQDSRNIQQRLGKLKVSFGDHAADSSKPEEIDRWLSKNTKAAATANRYRSAMSLSYREALRNSKVGTNPVRLVRQRSEGEGVIRFLRKDEEKLLRTVIEGQYPTKICELDVSLGTGSLRCASFLGGMRRTLLKRMTWPKIGLSKQWKELSNSTDY